MGHNIHIKDGKACFVENARKHRAWHKLGTVYDRPLTVQEALHGCHADYKVALQPLALITPTLAQTTLGSIASTSEVVTIILSLESLLSFKK